jgi:hypothetical protein
MPAEVYRLFLDPSNSTRGLLAGRDVKLEFVDKLMYHRLLI